MHIEELGGRRSTLHLKPEYKAVPNMNMTLHIQGLGLKEANQYF